MKRILISFFLFTITISCYSQYKSYKYNKFALRDTYYTGNNASILNRPFRIIESSENSYTIRFSITDKDYVSSTVTSEGSFMFGNSKIYTYKGQGLFAGHKVNIEIESSLNLKNLLNGNGYNKDDSNDKLQNYELHFFYWLKNEKRKLAKKNFYIYPLKSESISKKKKPDVKKIKIKESIYKISSKGCITVVNSKGEKVLLDCNKPNNKYVNNTVLYSILNDKLILEIGYNSQMDYNRKIFVVNTSNFKIVEFDSLCGAWDDIFYTEEVYLYYVCEYEHNNENKIRRLNFSTFEMETLQRPKNKEYKVFKRQKKAKEIEFNEVK